MGGQGDKNPRFTGQDSSDGARVHPGDTGDVQGVNTWPGERRSRRSHSLSETRGAACPGTGPKR